MVLRMPSSKQKDEDERFSRVQRDPRFWEMPEKQHKVKIDQRFQSMFHDQRFKVKYTVDKRGRPVNHTTAEDLKRFYQLSDDEEDRKGKVKSVKEEESGEDEEEDDEGLSVSADEDEDSAGSESDSDSGPDLARGKGNVETSSDEDEEEDEVEAALRREEEEIEHDWGDLCKDAPRTEQVSRRLAVCNMDWDRIKAKDLLALFQSFSPKGGAILSVKILLSDFGRERVQQETSQGPKELRALPDDSEDDTEEEKVYREKLRDYQFKRLKYYFAVVECDSSDTAAQIYSECDGFEYESSCSVLDLRFIPDDMTFEDEPKDVASDVNLSSYTPKLFTSAASSTSKVQLTWDETDHERVTALNRNFNKDELLNMDFKAYLASSSDEEEDEEDARNTAKENPTTAGGDEEEEELRRKSNKRSEEQLRKYRELLKGIQEKEKQQKQDRDMEMEITWVPGLKENAEQLLKKRLETKEPLTPWEQFLQKKKEKKKQKTRKQGAEADLSDEDDDVPSDVDLSDPFFSEELSTADLKKKPKRKKKEEERTEEEEEERQRQKAQMELLMEDDADEARHKHFDFDRIVEQQNLSKNKRKRLKKSGLQPQEDHFQVDVADPRFQAVYTSSLFNLDPTHPNFKRTKGTESLLQEKQRRRQDTEESLGPVTTATTTQSTVFSTTTTDAAAVSTTTSEKSGQDLVLSQLVKSIKSKTQQFQARKKPRPQ